MAKTRYNMNRFRKVYPNLRRSPNEHTLYKIETKILEFSSSDSASVVLDTKWTTPNVVIASTDNINVWISSIIKATIDGAWTVTVNSSADFTGEVHIQVSEGDEL